MACTTILVGKKASYDGSTMIARNDDSPSGRFTPKKYVVVHPDEQPRKYISVLSHVEIDLPDNPMRYTAVPNALEGDGIWAANGVNEANVAMTATETITSNPRVLGADPLVVYQPARDGQEEIKGGIGEEDIVCLVLPYIRSAREGVKRLGSLLEQYGTYEMNGIAFQDADEIWWLETIGGHHWIARKVPDDVYVIMPNQLGIDQFNLEDAFSEQKEYMCSADLKDFIEKYHLNLAMDGVLNPRDAFGSHDDSDHVYNTPRAWYMGRCLNPRTWRWDGPAADFTPYSDNIPWCMVPEKKVTVEDVKYVLSSHFQGTPYDPYAGYGESNMRGAYRSIGINRNDFMSLIQINDNRPDDIKAIQWLAFASNAFNVMVPFYADIETTPDYLSNTTGEVSTDNFYWSSRMIAAMADASYKKSIFHIERYQEHVLSKGHEIINRYDDMIQNEADTDKHLALKHEANLAVADMLKAATSDTLGKVLYELSNEMKNAYSRSDA
ncbi:dipeptidase [Coprococcus catus]|uniref:Dipeptidase n=1 Tax=Coprococcus catus TaxID=116085 RepID=A0A3E2XSA8_9FIRM|nr:C69 family dipeptidase [Coprococcus catus]RGC51294.1 dipeptidase [Coprococcus catus]